ncbi:MAG: hypothetical protein H7A37_00300 [Chlamydiales bacterium]|nr:hypothetical protein [Chlamydiia bacterium]MCP5506735.1 hypothetical protein [Chlamydiales bacterium]
MIQFHTSYTTTDRLPSAQSSARQLFEGSLNLEPLPFAHTITYIEAAKLEQQRKAEDIHKYQIWRLLRNVDDKGSLAITTLMPSKSQDVNTLARALRTGNWKHSIFSTERFGQCTFQAFKKKLITLEQFTTVFLRWAASVQFEKKDRPLIAHPVFNGEELTPNAEKLLLPALWKISNDEKERFLSLLKQAPESEKYFWTTNIPLNTLIRGKKREKHGQILLALDKIFVLFKMAKSSNFREWTLIIPSFTIFQAYLNAVFQENAVTIVPEFGIGTPEQIAFDIPQNQRLFALHFPGVKGLETGDGYYFGKYLSSFHDFYHSHRVSLIPPTHRLAYLRLYHVFTHCLELSKKSPERPLLSVQWPHPTDNCLSNRFIHHYQAIPGNKIEEFKEQTCHKIIDLEVPALDKYLQIFRSRGRGSYIIHDTKWNKTPFPEKVQGLTFTPFNFKTINRLHPEKYFNIAVSLHDMVTHRDQWKNSFFIDTLSVDRWTETNSIAIQACLINGFVNMPRSRL